MAVPTRIILTPNTVTARQRGTKPYLEYRFTYPMDEAGTSVFDGASVRIVVYDMDVYARSPLCAAEGGLANFTRGDRNRAILDDTPLPNRGELGTVRNPATTEGSGALLVLDGAIHKVKKQKPTDPNAWWFERTQTNSAQGTPMSIIMLRMATKEEEAVANSTSEIAQLIIPEKSASVALIKLALRVVLTAASGGVPEGGVLASNLCPEHSAACPPDPPTNPALKGFVTIDGSAILKGAPPTVVGPEGPAPVAPPAPTSRVMPFDLSGFYEAEHELGLDPPLYVGLNQAGHSLVGWFTRPAFGTNNNFLIPGGPGCFYVNDLAIEGVEGWIIAWHPQGKKPSTESVDAADDNEVNTCDPDRIEDSSPYIESGVLARPVAPVASDSLSLVFRLKDGNGGLKGEQLYSLRKVNAEVRWPWRVLSNPNLVTKTMRDMLIIDQVHPIAAGVWRRFFARFEGGAFIPGSVNTVQNVVQRWFDARGDSNGDIGERNVAMAQMGDFLESILGPFLQTPHRLEAVQRLHTYALQNTVTVNDAEGGDDRPTVTRSCMEWIQLMMDQRLGELIQLRDNNDDLLRAPNGKMMTNSEIYASTQIHPGFRDAQISASGDFLYVLNLDSLTVPGPQNVVVSISHATATVEKRFLQEDGSEVPDAGWIARGDDKKTLTGWYKTLGLSLDTKKAIGGAASLPSEAEFRSFADLQFADFQEMDVDVIVTNVGTISTPIGGLTAFTSYQFDLYLKNGVHLKTFFDKAGDASLGVSPTLPGGNFFEFSRGWGRFETYNPVTQIPPEDAIESIVKKKEVIAWTPVQFARDSSTLQERGLFERRIATVRRLFTEVKGRAARAIGYASPEHTSEYNKSLSLRRAVAVRTACKDALAPKQQVKDDLFDVLGLGEEPSTTMKVFADGTIWPGLLDPEKAGLTDDDKLRLKQESGSYPEWRVVDLFVGALLVARTKTKDEIKPGNEPPTPPPDDSDDDPPAPADDPPQSTPVTPPDVPGLPPSSDEPPPPRRNEPAPPGEEA